ncbi:MAG: CDP-alcohol phosphatidyltransferase family protein [Patescibacteria group bacterium]
MPSIKELRAICQTSEASPSLMSQSIMGKFNRVFSIYLTWIFIRLPFTPNQITVFGTVVYLLGAGLFLKYQFAWNLAGVLLIVLSFLIDAVDGELARYRKMVAGGGVGGVYVEPVSHDVQYGWVFLPIAMGSFWETGSVWPLVAGFAATTSKLLFRLLEFRYNVLLRFWAERKGETYGLVPAPQTTPKTLQYFVFRNFFTGTGLTTMLLIAVLVRRVDFFLYFYGASFFGLWLLLLGKQWMKIQRKLKEEHHAPTPVTHRTQT